VHDQLVQVTRTSLRLIRADTGALLKEWFPPGGLSIDVAAGSGSQAVLAAGDGNLVYLEIGEGSLTETGHLKLDDQIACLDLSPIGAESLAVFLGFVSPDSAGGRIDGPIHQPFESRLRVSVDDSDLAPHTCVTMCIGC